MDIQQKFSFPVACLVFGVIGLALGLTVARDGKIAGFVVGIAVIFAYYIVFFLAEASTKGYYAPARRPGSAASSCAAHLSRWMPNLVLRPFGIVALDLAGPLAEGRLPLRSCRLVMPQLHG